ncbi:hypothetical protein [Streptomyces caeruleatus]|uniref:Aromatic ring-opening dioxygenase LigA n=1 Tax=Streptomyces caeruleatus TaxID=661399 RepID=A0A124I879_9ACTN|nr:hypothetical protein [Streptomyces caeruleatus]KUN98549.1 hypothetical protein AQJ67_27865 [Streptomyces caeruleatus]
MAVKRIVLRAVIALTATAVGVLGYLYAHGDLQRWQDESALDGACDGLLDRNVVRDVLGPGAVEVESDDRAGAGLVGCQVRVDGGGAAEVHVLDTASAGDGWNSLYTGPRGETLSVPVGHGWAGLFGAEPKRVTGSLDADEDEDVTVSLLLRCAGTASVKGLSVTVETRLDKTLDDPANRPEFARIATSTAAKASKTRHCGAQLGRPVRSLGLPVKEDAYEPLGTAAGTCSGIPTARGVAVATETDRGNAPYEVCRLSDADLDTRYVLEAEFGPYAQEEFARNQEYGREDGPSPDVPAHHRDADGGVSWTTAKCADGTALFTLHVADERNDNRGNTASNPDLAYERTALRAFAEHSAQAHGCSAPVTP